MLQLSIVYLMIIDYNKLISMLVFNITLYYRYVFAKKCKMNCEDCKGHFKSVNEV